MNLSRGYSDTIQKAEKLYVRLRGQITRLPVEDVEDLYLEDLDPQNRKKFDRPLATGKEILQLLEKPLIAVEKLERAQGGPDHFKRYVKEGRKYWDDLDRLLQDPTAYAKASSVHYGMYGIKGGAGNAVLHLKDAVMRVIDRVRPAVGTAPSTHG
jgi:hypothetical protein